MEDLSDIVRHKIMPWSFEHESDEFWEDEGEHVKDLVSTRLPFSRHIVAVGDLHGDMPNARKVLTFAGVINEHGDWSGDVDFFVQTGDIIDRCVISLPSARCIHRFCSGDDTIPLFFFMERLRVQAAEVGGTVLSHLGNHEWMNAIGEFMSTRLDFEGLIIGDTTGDWRYVYPSELKTFGSIAARQRMLTTGRIGRAWAQNYTTASRLPLHPSLGPPNTPYPPQHMSVNFQKKRATLSSNIIPWPVII